MKALIGTVHFTQSGKKYASGVRSFGPDLQTYPVGGMDALWRRVKADPSDYFAWCSLVIEAEKSASEPEPLRLALDGFVSEWPLCYGYWKR